MRKSKALLLSVGLILPLWIQARNFQDVPPLAQMIAENLQAAIQNYKDDQVPEGAMLLCDVILMTRPEASWPEGFTDAVDSAKDFFERAAFSEGAGYIKRAMKIFNPDYSEPSDQSGGSMAAIGRLILNKINTAIENFKAGDADQGVLSILESLALLGPAL